MPARTASKTPKLASFPAATTLGGLEINGHVHVAVDGSEVVYGKAIVGRIRRGEKHLTPVSTPLSVSTVAPLGSGLLAVATFHDDAACIDLYNDHDERIGALTLVAFAVRGLVASAAGLVAWGSASEAATSTTVWWWPLPQPEGPFSCAAPIGTFDVDSSSVEVAFAGAELCIASGTRLWLATSAGATEVPLPVGLEPSGMWGSASSRVLCRHNRRFVVLDLAADGATIVQELPPVLKFARLSADGRRVIGYGEGHTHTTPADVRAAFPDWERQEFLATFDVDSGQCVGWTKSKVLTNLAVLNDDTVVTVALKGLGFVSWPA